jgi:hypothetical protein
MITAVRTLVYADDANAALRSSATSWAARTSTPMAGGTFPDRTSKLGVHPDAGDHHGDPWRTIQHHEISLMRDNLTQVVAELEAKAPFSPKASGTTAMR